MYTKPSSMWTSRLSARIAMVSSNSSSWKKQRGALTSLTIPRLALTISAATYRKALSWSPKLTFWCATLTSRSRSSSSSTRSRPSAQSARASLSSTPTARLEVLDTSSSRQKKLPQQLSNSPESSSSTERRLRYSLIKDASNAKALTVASSTSSFKAYHLALTMKVSRLCLLNSAKFNLLMYNAVRTPIRLSRTRAMFPSSLEILPRKPSMLCTRSRWKKAAPTSLLVNIFQKERTKWLLLALTQRPSRAA